ncbi:MAG: hypothetical protein WKG32_19885 [Gemmatimonadaceae bacterium]
MRRQHIHLDTSVLDAMYEETASMSPEEFAAYVARKAAAVRAADAARVPSASAAERGAAVDDGARASSRE